MNTRGEGPWNITLIRTVLSWGSFFFVFVFGFFSIYSSSKIHTFKTPEVQFIFGSLQSLAPSTDRISLWKQEDGGTLAL